MGHSNIQKPNKSSVSISIMRSTILLSAFPWPYITIRISSRTPKQTARPNAISSGKLFARFILFFAQKTVLRLLEPRLVSTTICFTLPHSALHNDTSFSSALYAASLYSTPYPVFLESCNNSVTTHTSTRRQNKNHETKTI